MESAVVRAALVADICPAGGVAVHLSNMLSCPGPASTALPRTDEGLPALLQLWRKENKQERAVAVPQLSHTVAVQHYDCFITSIRVHYDCFITSIRVIL